MPIVYPLPPPPSPAQGYLNYNSWIMFVQYAACFGVELTVNNTAAKYFQDFFDLSTERAALVASLFGLMNLFARSLGGLWSGKTSRRRRPRRREDTAPAPCWRRSVNLLDVEAVPGMLDPFSHNCTCGACRGCELVALSLLRQQGRQEWQSIDDRVGCSST